jgi:putative DNA primase/helicase
MDGEDDDTDNIANLAEQQRQREERRANMRGGNWPDPRPLPDGLLKVAPFNTQFLPQAIAPWIGDIGDRMQCPCDFIGIAAMAALGSLIGNKIGLRPKQFDDWVEVPNQWAWGIGRAGMLKTPSMRQALAPITHLESQVREANKEKLKEHVRALEAHKLRREIHAKEARKTGIVDAATIESPPERPRLRRYQTIDTTYEALGVILEDNPNGVLVYRDELVSLLRYLDQEEHSQSRGFFLQAWNGTSRYDFDRITRGAVDNPQVCISLLGASTPSTFTEYTKRTIAGGVGDDGLLQRFGLLTWPDQFEEWQNVDRVPDIAAHKAYWDVFTRLDLLTIESIRAETDGFDAIPHLHFDAAARGLFVEWHTDLERKLRSPEIDSALLSHLAKYRKLVPGLALINHLADGGTGAVADAALLRALSFAQYLETHAQRAYGSRNEAEVHAAKAIAFHIRKGDLVSPFTARTVRRPCWSGLSDREQVQDGLDLLVDRDWLAGEAKVTGGRPTTLYDVNPKVLRS